jgi:hypothetical protein
MSHSNFSLPKFPVSVTLIRRVKPSLSVLGRIQPSIADLILPFRWTRGEKMADANLAIRRYANLRV